MLHFDPVSVFVEKSKMDNISECFYDVFEPLKRLFASYECEYTPTRHRYQYWQQLAAQYATAPQELHALLRFGFSASSRSMYYQLLLDSLSILPTSLLTCHGVRDLIINYGTEVSSYTWDSLYQQGYEHARIITSMPSLQPQLSFLEHLRHRIGLYRSAHIDNLVALVHYEGLDLVVDKPYSTFFTHVGRYGTFESIERMSILHPYYIPYMLQGFILGGRNIYLLTWLPTYRNANPSSMLSIVLSFMVKPSSELSEHHLSEQASVELYPYLLQGIMDMQAVRMYTHMYRMLQKNTDLTAIMNWMRFNYCSNTLPNPSLPLDLFD